MVYSLILQIQALRSEFKKLDADNQCQNLTDILTTSIEEQNRIDAILSVCLPMLKHKHLMLASFDSSAARNEEFMVRNKVYPNPNPCF